MRRYRAVLAYDGTAYRGFQRQAGQTPTIQGAVEAALARVTGQTITVIGAGRTDAGVHALGQVIAFDADWRHEAGALLRALNATLPTDIALQSIAVADAGFHPRFDARSRTYLYQFYSQRERQPLWDRYTWHVPVPLDGAAMRQAAAWLVGRHDFATFGQPPQGQNTVRQVFVSALEGEARFCYRITADAFLQRMVRSIVGTLVQVGRGALTPDEFVAVFQAADRAQAGPVAPPHGLTLYAVEY